MTNNIFARRFESILVLTTTAGYLFRSLFYDARHFEQMISSAIADGVSIHTILRDLSHYDHTWNHNMPTIAAAIMCFVAWYLFHFLLFPSLKEEKYGSAEVVLSIVIIGLLFSSAYISLNSIDVVYRKNHWGKIIGLRDVTHFRNLYALSDSIAFLTLILIYEAVSQFCFKLYSDLEGQPNGYLIRSIIAILIFLTSFIIVVSQRMVPDLLYSQNGRTILGILLTLICAAALQEYYFRNIFYSLGDDSLLNKYQKESSTFFVLMLISCLLVLGLRARIRTDLPISLLWIPLSMLSFSISMANGRRKRQKDKKELTTLVSRKSAELQNLRSQINPHFLFNALNSLYATALTENSEKTAEGIQKLGDMMRFMLHENNRDRISLVSEISYLHNYIDIQQMRLDETQDIEIRVNMQDPSSDIYIAPMLLSPFIENAFKHGISLQKPSWIFITLTLDEAHIYFKVHNSVHARLANDPEKEHSGIGLSNVEKRLKLIYPSRYNLNIQKSSQDYFASLTLRY